MEHEIQMMWVKIGNFQPISRYISEMVSFILRVLSFQIDCLTDGTVKSL